MTTVEVEEGYLLQEEDEENIDDMMRRGQAELDPMFQGSPTTIGPSDRPPAWLEVSDAKATAGAAADQYVDTITYDMLDRGKNAVKAALGDGEFDEQYEYLDAQRRGEKERDWVQHPGAMTLGTGAALLTPDPVAGGVLKGAGIVAKGGGKVAGHLQRVAKDVPVLGKPYRWNQRARTHSKSEGRLNRLMVELFDIEAKGRDAKKALGAEKLLKKKRKVEAARASREFKRAALEAGRKKPMPQEMVAAREAEIAARENLIKSKSQSALDAAREQSASSSRLSEAQLRAAAKEAEAKRRAIELKELEGVSGMGGLKAGSKGKAERDARLAAIDASEEVAAARFTPTTGGALSGASADLVRRAEEGHGLSKADLDRIKLMVNKEGEPGPSMGMVWLDAGKRNALKQSEAQSVKTAEAAEKVNRLNVEASSKAHEVGRQSSRLDAVGGPRRKRVADDLRELSNRYTAAIPNQAGKIRAAVRGAWNQKGYAARALEDLARKPWSSYAEELRDLLPSLNKIAAREGAQVYDQFLAEALEDPQLAYEMKLAASQYEAQLRKDELSSINARQSTGIKGY